MQGPFASKTVSWGVDDRFSSIRIKNYGEKSTCVEMRLPSGLSNPYLVMAATIAAGISQKYLVNIMLQVVFIFKPWQVWMD